MRFYWNATSLWFVSSQDDQNHNLSLFRNFLVGENIRKLFNHLKTAFKLLIFISRRKFDLFSFKALTWLPIFYCCLIVVAPHLNECWLAGHTCSNGHISSFKYLCKDKYILLIDGTRFWYRGRFYRENIMFLILGSGVISQKI